MLSPDERLLTIVGPAYVASVLVAAWYLSRRGAALLRNVRDNVDASLWQDLGAPASVRAAVNDPRRRWTRFVRSGDYRTRCPVDVVEAIDSYRRRVTTTMIALLVPGLLIAYRFWPLLKPDWLWLRRAPPMFRRFAAESRSYGASITALWERPPGRESSRARR
jgi:hypothetical protein